MSFTDQKPFVVAPDDCGRPWGGYRDGLAFRCGWCGHRFVAGDVARWVYTNGSDEEARDIHGNPFICAACDGPRAEILTRLRAARDEFVADRFWWFRRHSAETIEAAHEAARDAERGR